MWVPLHFSQVIILLRSDLFKKIIFINNSSHRIQQNNCEHRGIPEKYYAFIWPDAVLGNSKHCIISTFYYFLIAVRDTESLKSWIHNCGALNHYANMTIFFKGFRIKPAKEKKSFLLFQSRVTLKTVYFFTPKKAFTTALIIILIFLRL